MATTEIHAVTETRKAVIAASAALSGEVDIKGFRSITLEIPSSWTTANITFQAASKSGGTFRDVYDSAGNEYTVTVSANRMIVIDAGELPPLRFIKLRSGTTAVPVNQAAERIINLICKG